MKAIPSEWLQPGAIVPVTPEVVRDLVECVRVAYRAGQEAERDYLLSTEIHSCHANCQRFACVQTRKAVETEREACAKMCESMPLEWTDQPDIAQAERATMLDCAATIRARGQQ